MDQDALAVSISQAKDDMRLVLGAINEAPGDRQVPMLREYFQRKLDQAEDAELELYDMLGECLTVASQNIQDVRLAAVEERLDHLENPDFVPGQFLVDLALLMVFEVGIVIAPQLVLTGAMSRFVTQTAAARVPRVRVKGANLLSRVQAEKRIRYTRLREADDALAAARDRKAVALRSSQTGGMWGPSSLASLERSIVDRTTTAEARQASFEVLVAQEKRLDDLLAMMRSSGFHKKVEAAVQADGTTIGGKLAKLSDFLDHNDGAETAMRRVAEDVASEIRNYLTRASSAAAGNGQPFTLAGVVGGQARTLRLARRGVRYEYQSLRAYLAHADDDAVLEDEELHEVVQMMVVSATQADALAVLSTDIQPSIVLGFEVLLWTVWLKRIGALEDTPRYEAPNETPVGSLAATRSGGKRYLVDRAWTQKMNNVPVRWTSGKHYPAIDRLSDQVAHYLWERFARAYLEANPELVSFDFDPEELSGAAALPLTTFWGRNAERDRRMAQTKACVETAFWHFSEQHGTKRGLGLVNHELPTLRDAVVYDPATKELVGSGLEPQGPDAEEIRRRLHEAGVFAQADARSIYHDVEQLLVSAERELEWMSVVHLGPLVEYVGDLDATAARERIADALGRIAEYRQTLAASEHEVDHDLAGFIDQDFGTRIQAAKTALNTSTKGSAGRPQWRYFDPVVTPESEPTGDTP